MMDCPHCGMPLSDDGSCLTDGCEAAEEGHRSIARIFDRMAVSRFGKESPEARKARYMRCSSGCYGCARQVQAEYRPILERGTYAMCGAMQPGTMADDFEHARSFLDGAAATCLSRRVDSRPRWGAHPRDWVDPNPPTVFDGWTWARATVRSNARLRAWEEANGKRPARKEAQQETPKPRPGQKGLF